MRSNPVTGPGTPRGLTSLLLLMALACLSSVGQARPAAGGYRIAGIVVNAVTDEPVRHVTVAALNEEDSHTVASVESGEDGRFSLEGLAAAKYQLTASKRGFRTAAYDEHEEYSTAIVTGPAQETEDLRFRMMPGSILRGVVTTEGGDPVEGATVMLFLKPRPHRVNDRITQADSTTTDDTGAYEFIGLAEGDYLLAVKADPWYALHRAASRGASIAVDGTPEPRTALDVAYPITFYDETTDETFATTISLARGDREEANVTLHAVPALHLVVDTQRKPDGGMGRAELRQTIFGMQVSAVSAGFMDAMRTGTTEFNGVAPGLYELVQGDPPRIAELDAATSQQVDPQLGTLTVTVTGTLRSATGTLQCGANALTNLTIESVGGSTRQNAMGTNCNHGEFTFQGVPPGTWRLSVQSQSGQLQVATIAVGNRAHGGNEFTAADRPLALTVTVSESATQIVGFARKDGKGNAGAMVVLVPADLAALPSLARRDQSDSDGSFSLRNVVPGRYTVVAIEDGWEVDWSRPEVIARYLPGGISVTVTSSSGKLLTLPGPVPVESREP